MTVAVQNMRVVYTGNGVVTNWPANFSALDDGDVEVYLYEIATDTLTLLSGATYNINGVPGDTFSIDYPLVGTPIAATHKLIIQRIVDLLQPSTFSNTVGFDPATLTLRLDEQVRMIQQVADAATRAVKVNISGSQDSDDILADLNAAVIAAENSATAAAASEADAEAAEVAAEAAQVAAEAAAASINLPLVVANTMLVANSAGTLRENKTFPETRALLATAVYVATQAALKALDTTKDTVAYLTDNVRSGLFIWRTGNFAALVTADTLGGVYMKADAIATTVGAWVRQYEGAVRPEWFGAVGDNATTDDAAEMNAALALVITLGGGAIELGPKRYRMSTALTGSLAQGVCVRLYGQGPDLSELVFASGVNGLVITIDGDSRNDGGKFTYDELTLATLSNVAATAATFTGVRTSGMTSKMLSSKNIKMKGTTSALGWGAGAKHDNIYGINYDNPEWLGKQFDKTANAFEFRGANNPTSAWITNPNVTFFNKAFWIEGTFEGIVLDNPFIVSGVDGVYHDTAIAEPQLEIHGGHMNTNRFGVFGVNVVQSVIEGCLFYEDSVGGTGSWVGVQLANCADTRIYGNGFHGWNGPNATRFGVVIGATGPTTVLVFGNTLRGLSAVTPMTTGIVIDATAVGSVRESNNTFKDVTTRTSGPAASREARTYYESVLKTLTGGAATETVQVAIPADVFSGDPIYAHLVSESGLTYIVSEYSFSDGLTTSINCVFRITKADGTNLAAGAQRFGFMAVGY